MKNFQNRSKGFFVIQIIEFIVTSVLAYVIDSCFKINTTVDLMTITNILISSTLTILGLWVSCYFLAIQIYKNKYPMDLIKNKLKVLYVRFVVSISMCFSVGIFYLFVGPSIISTIIYVLNCVISIGFILYCTYKVIDDYSINKLFSDYVENINAEINDNCKNTTEKEIKSDFEKLYKLYNESFRDRNYYICEEIIKKTSNSFKGLMAVSSKLLLDDDSENKNDTLDLADEYISFNITQLNKALNCTDMSIFNYVLKYQYYNIVICVEARQFQIYKKYINCLLSLIYFVDSNKENVSRIYNEIYSVGAKIIEDNIESNYLSVVLDLLDEIIKAKNFERVDSNIELYYKVIMRLLQLSINKDETYYSVIFNSIKENIVHLSLVNKNFENTFISFLNYANYLLQEEKDYKYISDYLNLYSKIEEVTCSDVRWVNYHFAFLSELANKYPANELDIVKIKNELIYSTITKSRNIDKIILPKIEILKTIEKYEMGKELDSSINDFIKICRIAILKNNIQVLYKYINEYSTCLKNINKNKKDLQINLLKVYYELILNAVGFSNKSMVSLLFEEYETIIRELDKEKQVSKSLAEWIFDEALSLASNCFNKSEDLVSKTIDMLHGFVKEENQVHFAVDKEEIVIKKIYNIGLLCIENNNENLLRQVSNAIGWIILSSIQNKKKTNVYKYGILRAIDLYHLSKFMNVSTKTKIFIMTLFTTIGSFCQTDRCLYLYGNMIIETIIHEDKDIIKTAIELRTHENNMWENLMSNPEQYGNLFYDKFIKAQERNLSKKQK